jgi:hypothetical protein
VGYVFRCLVRTKNMDTFQSCFQLTDQELFHPTALKRRALRGEEMLMDVFHHVCKHLVDRWWRNFITQNSAYIRVVPWLKWLRWEIWSECRVTSHGILSGGTGLEQALLWILIVIIPRLPHTHLPPPHEVFGSPDQAAHYHTLGPQMGIPSVTWSVSDVVYFWHSW